MSCWKTSMAMAKDVVLFDHSIGIELSAISNGDGTFTYVANKFWVIGAILAKV